MLLLQILIIINIISFGIGYTIGKITSNNITTNSVPVLKDKEIVRTNKVSIDTTKYVTTIKTDSLEKKYDNLGDIKQSAEQIDVSVNKLKNMKG